MWLLAKLPENYEIFKDQVCSYLVFLNSHDGSGSIKVAMTPIRVVCQNTFNLALRSAKRNHTGGIQFNLGEAKHTLSHAEYYMDRLKIRVTKVA